MSSPRLPKFEIEDLGEINLAEQSILAPSLLSVPRPGRLSISMDADGPYSTSIRPRTFFIPMPVPVAALHQPLPRQRRTSGRELGSDSAATLILDSCLC
jgi:hypothetical protein